MDQQNGEKGQTAESEQRSYIAYNSGGDLKFCPLKDLNLPASYKEVLDRFQRLQGERAVEILN